VMKRIAAPMVGGMLSSTVLTLAVIPAVYSLWKERDLAHASQANAVAVRPSVSPAGVL
jgi:Cu(I)/Ag(I) efflux system membrane protein CusA/SilA